MAAEAHGVENLFTSLRNIRISAVCNDKRFKMALQKNNAKNLNRFMHPRNPYKTPPDFSILAKNFAEFKKHTNESSKGKVSIDYSNADALRSLTQTLLKKDFDLEVNIPADRLIPTLPLRLNYILWIEDLLQFTRSSTKGANGVDIGAGASCIYPLLGSKMNGWQFIALEADEKSVEYCRENVEKNSLGNLITVVPVDEVATLQTALKNHIFKEPFDFCMCNPPFFSSMDEMITKHNPPKRVSSAAHSVDDKEVVTDGGEVAFVTKIIDDSFKLKDRITLYTSMLGKKSSLIAIKNELRNRNITHFTTTEFCQGRTIRWGIAWTHTDNINLDEIPTVKKVKDKPPFTLLIPKVTFGKEYTTDRVSDKIIQLFSELKLEFWEESKNKNNVTYRILAKENTWIHQRRKARAHLHNQTDQEPKGVKRFLEDSESNDESPEAKRSRIDEELSETGETSAALLCAKLKLARNGKHIFLELQFLDGLLGRDGAYQLLQFFRNKLR